MPSDAPTTPYTERLWPGPWLWLLALGGVGSLGVAYAVAVAPWLGWLIGAAGLLLVALMVLRIAARIEVRDDGLRAGRALLPWQYSGRVVALDGAGAQRARGPQGDPSAFLLLRPGVGPGAVVVEVTDPEDPHRTWLLASRNPRELTRAIERTRGRLAP